jgi:uncharacterized protein (UPF0333 family)
VKDNNKKTIVYKGNQVTNLYKVINTIAYGFNMKRANGNPEKSKKLYRETKANVLMGLGLKYNKDDKTLIQVEGALKQFSTLLDKGTKEIIAIQKTCKEMNDWNLFPIEENKTFVARVKKMTPQKKAKKVSVTVKKAKEQEDKIANLESKLAELTALLGGVK